MKPNRRCAYVYNDRLWRHELRADHPMRPVRLRYTYELLQAYNAFSGNTSRLVEPRQATEEEVRTFHAPEYVAAVRALSSGLQVADPGRFGFNAHGDNPPFPGMYEASMGSTGGSLTGAELILSGEVDVAFNNSGGLHHAGPSSASGFCVFNDPVVAIKRLTQEGLKVAYVDIDAHHGDGVQNAFYDTDQVLTISLHESGQYLFPGTGFVDEVGTGKGKGYAVNVPLFPYTGDETYLWAFAEVAPPLVERFKPDVLVAQLGIDTYHNDPLTHLMITSRGYARAVQRLLEMCPRVLALGGGGYDLMAVARCWALAYGLMLGQEWPDEIPPEYRDRYGISRLRDTEEVPTEVAMRKDARRYAEEVVCWLHKEIFPIHGRRAA